MGARTLASIPRAQLLHQEIGLGPRIRRYSSTAITVERPESGVRRQLVRCPRCGAAVTLRVSSVPATRRRRMAWVGLTVLSATLLPVLVANGGQDRTGSSALAGGAVALALFALVFLFFVSIARWWREDGVSVLAVERVSMLDLEHLIGFPTIGRSIYTKRGRTRMSAPRAQDRTLT